MDRNNRIPGNNKDNFYDNEPGGRGRRKSGQASDDLFASDAPVKRTPKKSRKKYVKRSLFMEYVHSWYVFLVTILLCAPAYMTEIFLGSLFVAKDVPPMLASLLTMFLGGFIATLPLLILNIYLIVKKKKYYAIAIQLIAMELLGLLFYLYSKIAISWS